jgi:hypothetical protein
VPPFGWVSTPRQPQEHRRSAPIACSLAEADLANRQDRWLQLWQRAGVNAVTTSNGLQLLFRAAPGVEPELNQLAELERDCCAFADWSVRASGNELVLDMTAPTEEGITAVQAMFGKLRSNVQTTSG